MRLLRKTVDGLPSKVVDIAIEGPVEALRWLQRHESVRNKPVAIHGISRGAELAMIIATLSPDPTVPRLAAVSSLSGSDRIVKGFSWKWSKKSRKKAAHRKARAWLWKGEYLIPGTPIPVERCDAPVLLIQKQATTWNVKTDGSFRWVDGWMCERTKRKAIRQSASHLGGGGGPW